MSEGKEAVDWDQEINHLLEQAFELGSLMEVEAFDPAGRRIVITRELYETMRREDAAVFGMRVIERAIQESDSIRLDARQVADAIENAKVIEIDPDGEMGTDAAGNPFDCIGLISVGTHQYPDDVIMIANEFCALIDHTFQRQAIRLVVAQPPG